MSKYRLQLWTANVLMLQRYNLFLLNFTVSNCIKLPYIISIHMCQYSFLIVSKEQVGVGRDFLLPQEVLHI
jgi:hypothetical protein